MPVPQTPKPPDRKRQQKFLLKISVIRMLTKYFPSFLKLTNCSRDSVKMKSHGLIPYCLYPNSLILRLYHAVRNLPLLHPLDPFLLLLQTFLFGIRFSENPQHPAHSGPPLPDNPFSVNQPVPRPHLSPVSRFCLPLSAHPQVLYHPIPVPMTQKQKMVRMNHLCPVYKRKKQVKPVLTGLESQSKVLYASFNYLSLR